MIQSLRIFSQDIKLSHTFFALPFVGTGLLFGNLAFPSRTQLVSILVCMVSARSFAMGMNRYLDADIDNENGRTKNRAVPSGRLSKNTCLFWSLLFGIVFIGVSWSLSQLAGLLAIPLLVILASYSLMKRVSWLTHWYLGVCLGLAPLAAQLALTGQVSLPVCLIGVSVCFWTAGFDLLYSLQDRQFDVSKDLKSVPAVFGARKALASSMASFVVMVLCLIGAGTLTTSGLSFYLGVLVVSAILCFEHWLVRDAWHVGISKNINAAFFTSNAFVSVAIFFFTLLDRLPIV